MGRQRDAFQPELMEDWRHPFEEVGDLFIRKLMREYLVRLSEALQ